MVAKQAEETVVKAARIDKAQVAPGVRVTKEDLCGKVGKHCSPYSVEEKSPGRSNS